MINIYKDHLLDFEGEPWRRHEPKLRFLLKLGSIARIESLTNVWVR